MTYDLLIVGAGPAGCAAAVAAAKHGLRVAIVERRRLPRHKTCGGGVPATVEHYFPGLSIADLAEASIRNIRHTWRHATVILAPMTDEDEPVKLYGVCRDRFDAGLAAHAVACGAELLEGVTVREVSVDRGGADLRGELGNNGAAWRARAEYVIGADGATGPVARTAGLSVRRTSAIALEFEVPCDWSDVVGYLDRNTMQIEYGAVRNGYAWAFPKADHLNIGAGVFRGSDDARGGHLSEALAAAAFDLCASLGIQFRPPRSCMHYHPVPLWAGRCRLHHPTGRALLAGDAAALVNPLFGDGILNAVRSGHLAGEAAATGRTLQYTADIYDEIGRDLAAAERMARVFYSAPEICLSVGARRPTATRTAARLLCGEVRYRDLSGRALRRMGAALRKAVLG